jgi:hypothetical protein
MIFFFSTGWPVLSVVPSVVLVSVVLFVDIVMLLFNVGKL